jgi:hypothetical protein
MFIDALTDNAAGGGMTVEVTTTSEKPELLENKFKVLQEQYVPLKVKLRYSIRGDNEHLPHYRRVTVRAKATW